MIRLWLARLAFSFLVVAAVLAWEGRRAAREGRKATAHYAGAIVLAGLGVAGIRQRHRRDG